MAQTTPEQPTLISPTSETEAKPYMPPAKKNHVPAGVEKLIIVGITLLATVLGVVFIFSHKLSPTKAHSQAATRIPARQQTSAATDVMPADQNNTPSAATGNDPDSITPNAILATKNSLEAQKRHAKEAEEAATKPSGTGNGTASGTQQAPGLLAPRRQLRSSSMLHQERSAPSPPFSPRHTMDPLPRVKASVGLGPQGRNTNPEPPIASQCAHGMMRSPRHESSSRARVSLPQLTQHSISDQRSRTLVWSLASMLPPGLKPRLLRRSRLPSPP